MSTHTQSPARPRRFLLIGRRGAALLTQAPSVTSPAHCWRQTIPLPGGPVACDCRGYRAHGHCLHQEAGEALREEYLTIREVQAGMSLRTLRQTAEDTHPDNLRSPWAGAVTLTWLAAEASLEERLAQRSVAA